MNIRKTRIPLPRQEQAFLGIDPGTKGAACLYVPKTGTIVFYDGMSCSRVGGFSDWLHRVTSHHFIALAVLEKVHAMPQQGVSSMFSFGMHFGAAIAALECHRIRYELLPPQRWMLIVNVSSNAKKPSKTRTLAAAVRIFGQRERFVGPRGGILDGRADAALMAYAAEVM